MLHHQFRFFISLGRQILHLCHHAGRIIQVTLCRLRGASLSEVAALQRRHEKSQKNPLLLHYHIFKNAGSSFEWALEKNFGDSFRCYDMATPGGVLSADDVAEYVARTPKVKVISSHQATLPPPMISGRETITSILIRDPLARIRSIYAFERRQDAQTPGATKAKELDFREYVAWRLASGPVMLCNFQVHFCSRNEKGSRPVVIGTDELRKAAENLQRIDIVGTVERYDEWLALAQSILSVSFPELALSSTRKNVTVSGETFPSKAKIFDDLIEDLGHATVQQLLKCNELDMQLYKVANDLLTRRLEERGIEIQGGEIRSESRQELEIGIKGNN